MAIERAAAGARRALASRPVSETLATIAIPTDDYVGWHASSLPASRRLDLDFAHVDDLQLATETRRVVLGSGSTPATVSVETDDTALFVLVRPFSPDLLRRRLLDGYESLELRAVLEQLVDGVAERADPDRADRDGAIELRVDLPTR
jgi:hypothetical protein